MLTFNANGGSHSDIGAFRVTCRSDRSLRAERRASPQPHKGMLGGVGKYADR